MHGGIWGRGLEDWRRKLQKTLEWLGLLSGSSLKESKALAKFGNLHERIAQKDTAQCSGSWGRSGSCDLQCGKLLSNFRRPWCGLRGDMSDGEAKGGGVAPLCGDAAEFKQRSQIIRTRRENLLYELLKVRFAVPASLAFNLKRELIGCAKVPRV